MHNVKIDVSGVEFKFSRKILENEKFENHTLTKLCGKVTLPDELLKVAVDRSSDIFAAILSYYQTEKLHMPLHVCPGQFKDEMEYWGIDPYTLESCCLYRYFTFMDDMETHERFRNIQKPNNIVVYDSPAISRYQKVKQKTWKIVDNQDRSILSKLYVVLLFLVVVLSVVGMSYSTEPYLRRPLTVCEYKEYLKETDHPYNDAFQHVYVDVDCTNGGNDKSSVFKHDDLYNNTDWNDLWTKYPSTSTSSNASRTARSSTNGPSSSTVPSIQNGSSTPKTTLQPKPPPKGSPAPIINQSQPTTTLPHASKAPAPSTSASSVVTPSTKKTPRPTEPRPYPNPPDQSSLPNLTAQHEVFDLIDLIVLSFFSADFLLRILTCPSILQYFTSIINVLDTCALTASYIHLIAMTILVEERYSKDGWVQKMEAIQILRIFRVFRLVKNVRASKVLSFSLKQNAKDMLLLALFLFLSISLFANLLYFIEPRTTLISIPEGWYWAVITLTTVGYGDIYPTTGAGRFVSCVCAIFGVLLLAITLPMFVNNFLTLYHFSCIDDTIQRKREKSIRSKKCKSAFKKLQAVFRVSQAFNKGKVSDTNVSNVR